MGSLFKNFYPNQREQIDFAEKGTDNFLVMVDVMSGFFQIYKVKIKSYEQAILHPSGEDRLRLSQTVHQGSGTPFLRRLPSLASQSDTAVRTTAPASQMWRHCVGQLKTLLKKCGYLSQLQIHELVYCINCREQNSGMGSAIARFLGKNCRGAIPNSLDRNINWKLMMENRAQQHQKRVD